MTSPIRKFAVRRPHGTSEDLPVVFHGSQTKAALHRTIHEAEKSVEQLAFECRISTSYLYRAGLEGESGCRFPVELAVPLMRSAHDYRLLDVLAGECDRAVVSMGRVARMKGEPTQAVNEVAGHFSEAVADVLKFFASPDQAAGPELVEVLRRHIADVASLARAVAGYRQGDLL